MFFTNHRSATIVMYHSVTERSDNRIDPSIVVSPTDFEQQIEHLVSRTNIISLEQYVRSVHNGIPAPPNSVVLTFDDGYKDNFTTVYPILKKYGLPATFFLATGYIETDKVKWENWLTHLIWQSRAKTVSVKLNGNYKEFGIGGEEEKLEAIRKLVWLLEEITIPERQQILDQLQEQLDVEPDLDDLMLSWDEVREMSKTPGISFGAHTVNHFRLSRLSTAEMRKEILESKLLVESEINKPVRFFAYPYGELTDFNEEVKQILKSNGFDCAVTTVYGQNNLQSDLFQLKRVSVEGGYYGVQFWLGFNLRRSPLGQPLKRAVNLWNQIFQY